MQTLYILKASGRLTSLENQIKTAFEKGLEQVQAVLSLPDVDVVIADNPDAAIPETGVGGFAPSAHLLYISIDPAHPTLKIHEEIQSTLAHELNHCARWNAVGYGETLLEAVISEGLADHFDIEVNGGDPKPWSIAVSGAELTEVEQKAQQAFSNKKYDHDDWFFGSQSLGIPRWAGYSLGYKLVGNYLKDSGKKASELTDVPAEEFLVML